jgi:hypothetical protein
MLLQERVDPYHCGEGKASEFLWVGDRKFEVGRESGTDWGNRIGEIGTISLGVGLKQDGLGRSDWGDWNDKSRGGATARRIGEIGTTSLGAGLKRDGFGNSDSGTRIREFRFGNSDSGIRIGEIELGRSGWGDRNDKFRSGAKAGQIWELALGRLDWGDWNDKSRSGARSGGWTVWNN